MVDEEERKRVETGDIATLRSMWIIARKSHSDLMQIDLMHNLQLCQRDLEMVHAAFSMFSESDSTRGTTVCLDRGALQVTHVLFAVAAVAAAPMFYLPGAATVCVTCAIICPLFASSRRPIRVRQKLPRS